MPAGGAQVVVLTPQGRGAIATLEVSGPRATEIVGQLFFAANGRSLAVQPLDRIVFGRWQSAQGGEELVVCRRTDERIEIHCHGGQAAGAAIIASLAELGCVASTWHQSVRETAPDAIAAEARIALTAATTERTAAILWDQYSGALKQAVDEALGHITAGRIEAALTRVTALVEYRALGAHLTSPWGIAFAGRPNVGKSSLINALVGFERAIVHDTPGTTRDLVTAMAAFEGWPVELTDTAGLHESTNPLEAAGIKLARDYLARADLVVLVFDAARPWSAEDDALVSDWPRALSVHNKVDLVENSSLRDRPAGLHLSARTGQGTVEMQRAIAARLVPTIPGPGEAIPFTAEQFASLDRAQAALSTGQTVEAQRELRLLIGSSGGVC